MHVQFIFFFFCLYQGIIHDEHLLNSNKIINYLNITLNINFQLQLIFKKHVFYIYRNKVHFKTKTKIYEKSLSKSIINSLYFPILKIFEMFL